MDHAIPIKNGVRFSVTPEPDAGSARLLLLPGVILRAP